ncbi:MAG: cytochrome c oxidase subunit II [Candidatus Omnitrophica bacterium]|nr:cytochrome c oxidase subunit II [Candidatus Omnitrophota bacterium]MCB9748099.1 cytochrome c oxidase subunit II [Candidatus Omnitrophota bacterium]
MSLREFFYLPINASSHGHEIDMMIYLIHFLMFALFFGWGIYFFIAVFKFRKRANHKANYHGVHSHISSYLEVGIVVFEALLLVGFSLPFWSKQVSALPNRPNAVNVRVNAEQFAWNVHYPGADGIFGNTDIEFFDKQTNPMGIDPNDPNGKDDFTTINQLHLPIGRPVIIDLTSRDVIHSFFIPVMRVKQDAIPGLSIPVWFTPTKSGKWEIACAQLCGIGHYYMRGNVIVHHEDEYDAWLAKHAVSADAEGSEEYDDFWN